MDECICHIEPLSKERILLALDHQLISPKDTLQCVTFLPFSRFFPPLISSTSLAVFGTTHLSATKKIMAMQVL